MSSCLVGEFPKSELSLQHDNVPTSALDDNDFNALRDSAEAGSTLCSSSGFELGPRMMASSESCGLDEVALRVIDTRASTVTSLQVGHQQFKKGRVAGATLIRNCQMEQTWKSPTNVPSPAHTFRQKVCLMFEEPGSSLAARRLWVVTAVLISSCVLFLLLEPIVGRRSSTEKSFWFGVELFYTVAFTVELLVRLAVVDALGTITVQRFLLSPMTILDIIAIIPGYVGLAFWHDYEARLLRILRLARLCRIATIAKFAREFSLAAPVAMCLVVVWGIYLKHGLEDS